MLLIEKTADLESFCKKLKNQSFITIDLEFLREKTYYAQLCLIQVACEDASAIIDPLAKDIDLSSFFTILKNKKIMKVFHSGRQDVEILYLLSGFIPAPMFDSQIAGMALGYGESASYESLVNSICKIELDKTSRLSDWSKRPLSEAQLNYAVSDVTHLVTIYKVMSEKLIETNRTSWIEDELKILSNPKTYDIDPFEVWQKIRHRSHNAKFLTTLRELAAWRELRAQRKNTPRQSIIKDDCLLNVAASCPISVEEVADIRNIRKDVASGRLAYEMIEIIELAKKISSTDYVKIKKEKAVGIGCSSLYELLKLLLKIKSQEIGIVSKLIANDDELKLLSTFSDKISPSLKGWRYEVFGQDAIALREGNISISFDVDDKKICIKKIAE